MMNLTNTKKGKISITQVLGFVLLLSGAFFMVYSGFFKHSTSSGGVSIFFFITMLGFALTFPEMLKGNDGLSTMRIVVFMMTNVICMLLLKIGWSQKITSLAEIGLDGYWMGVIAFVFGAKATQSYFESKLAVLKSNQVVKRETPGEPEPNSTETPRDNSETMAENALALHETEIRRKYNEIIETLEVGITASNQFGIIAYLSSEAPADFPKQVWIKNNSGQSLAIPVEAIKPEEGQINSGLSYRVNNADDVDVKGAFGGVVVSKDKKEPKLLLTCSHVALSGSSNDLKGYASNGSFDIQIQIYDGATKKGVGDLIYAKRDDKNDTALIELEDTVDWNNELPEGTILKPAIAVDTLSLGNEVYFYSSFRSETMKGVLHKRKSSHSFSLQYDDGTIRQYKGLIIVGNNYGGYWSTMSEKGDSGSILYDKDQKPFGLIIGGNSQFTFALPLTKILNETGTKIYQS